jgi:transglutaminase-like putative cysteine protease
MEDKRRIHLLTEAIVLALFCSLAVPAVGDVVYWNPRPYNVTHIFELEPDPNKIDRARDLKLWLSLPREWESQKAVQILSMDPPPDGTYEDPEFGNRMAFWDFGKGPEKKVYTATIKSRLESYDIKVEVDPNKVGTYDKSSPEYKLYTRSEHTICLTPKIYELAKEAVGDEKNPYLQARRIAQYVYRKVHYKMLDHERGRGIQCLLDYPVKDPKTGEEYYEGNCMQISAMVVALCRAVGIPARCVAGPCGFSPASELKPLYDFMTKLNPRGLAGAVDLGQLPGHMWTEFYIPNYGWIPEDYSRVPFNCRTVCFKGRDIKIGPECPEGDDHGYGLYWVLLNGGRADCGGAVWNIAKIHTARVKSLFEFDPFPADGLVDYRDFYDTETRGQRNPRARRLWWEQFDYKTRGFPDLTAAFKQQRSQRLFRDAWVCHVLKNIVGQDRFSRIVNEYERMRVSSRKAVPVAQFQQLSEGVYGQPLGWFFEPWMDESQLPQFKLDQVNLTQEGDGWCVSGHLLQTGKLFYRLPVELALQTERGTESPTLWQEKRDTEFQLHTSQRPVGLIVDPNREIPKIERFSPHLAWWRWVDSQRVRVIYGTGAESEANKAGAESFVQMGVPVESQFIKSDTEATPADLDAECLILIGRPAVNKITERFQGRFPIKFEGAKFTWQGKVYDQATQGVIAVVDEGRSSRRLTMLFAGLGAEASRDFGAINMRRLFNTASYLIYDGNKCVLSGEWENADPDLVWLSGTQVTDNAESFVQAVSEGDIELVKSLLSKGVDVSTPDGPGQNALLIAVRGSNKALVELLIAKGANVNAKGPGGATFLHIASRLGYRDIVELLIAKGADVNARNARGQTPLSLAEQNGQKEVAEILRHHGGTE